MDNKFIRTQAILGKEAMEKLKEAKVAVFGIGGVGSYAVESLVRSGLGNIVLVDYDCIDITNINRQVMALEDTVGKYKVDVMKARILEINPRVKVETYKLKYCDENKDSFNFSEYDYVIDAIDMVSSKLSLIETSYDLGIPIISAMGAGNKLDPTRVKISDIYETKICPLARVMRRELKKRNIPRLKVAWSDEEPININLGDRDKRKASPASLIFVPAVVGMSIGCEIVKDIGEVEV